MKSVTVVAAHAYPLRTIGVWRPMKIAEWFARRGAAVRVVTFTPADEVQEDLPFEVVRLDSFGYFAARKYRQQTAAGGKASLLRSALAQANRYGALNGQRYPDYFQWVVWRHREFFRSLSTDILLTTSPPFAVSQVGLQVKSQHPSTYWIADWRDLWMDHSVYPGLPAVRALESRAERRVVTGADMNAVVSSGQRALLAARYPDANIAVLRNGFDEIDPAMERAATGVVRIAYCGALYPGRAKSAELLLERLARLRRDGLLPEFVLRCCGACAPLVEIAKRFGLGDRIEYLGQLSHEQSLDLQRNSDLLLVLEDAQERGVLTGKLYEYVGRRRYILAVGPGANSEMAKLLRDAGNGEAFDERTDLAAVFAKAQAAGSIDEHRLCEMFSRERQLDLVLGGLL